MIEVTPGVSLTKEALEWTVFNSLIASGKFYSIREDGSTMNIYVIKDEAKRIVARYESILAAEKIVAETKK